MTRSKSETDENFQTENLKPYLSDACIRSFVKQLASSTTSNVRRERQSLERKGIPMELQGNTNANPPQQHKKQVRRRLHTRKPYQEKMLNMAEARREIVSALKLHRMKQKQQIESGPDFQTEVEAKLKSRIYASNSYTSSDTLFPVNHADCNLVYLPGCCCSPYSWSAPPIYQENLDFILPTRTLGLNLNIQEFITTPSSVYLSSSSKSTSSSSAPPSAATTEESPVVGATTPVAEETVEIGDRNQIQQLKSMEAMRCKDEKDEEFVSSPFDEVIEFPAWLNANESFLQHANEFCTDDYFQDPALPCMDIEEIEGMDGDDWLA